ncbi:MAG: TlpA family protein disulfide reductase [Acidimicrobiales bacterium]
MSATTEAPRAGPSRRARWTIGVAAVLAAVLIAVLSVLTGAPVTSTTTPTSALVGRHVAAFAEAGLTGGTVHAPWSRHHAGVVIFFASWCGPCQREMPQVAAYLRTHSFGSVQVVGVDALDARGSAQRFVTRDAVLFPVSFDPNGSVTTGVFGFATLPETVFVNARGVVTDVYYGAIPTGRLVAGVAQLAAG